MMHALTLEQFDDDDAAFNRWVDATPGIDPFCSGTDWVLPVRATWGEELEPWLRAGDAARGAFLLYDDTLFGFDLMWGFACPLVGDDPAEFVAPCLEAAGTVLVPGVVFGSPWWHRLVDAFAPHARLAQGQTTRRWIATLDGGVDGFLARRTAKFRENLRRAQRRAADEGVIFVDADGGGNDGGRADADVEALFARVAAVERRSWKGEADTGLSSRELMRFYEDMARRLVARGALRMTFAQQDGVDVGYLFGGVRGPLFRGLQKSYDAACAHLSLGHLMQLHRMHKLAADDPEVTRYDLGMDMDYKRQWGEEVFETVTLAAIRS